MAITVDILGGLVQLTGNPVEIECSGGSAPAGSSDYKILLRVISEDGKLTGAPFEDAKAPNASGVATFDISGYVDQPVQKSFDYPFSAAMVAYPTQAFSIQVQAGESYWDSSNEYQEVWGAVEADVVQMLKGGTNPRQISEMASLGKSFYNMYVEGNKFLTARPMGEEVHPTQLVKLWYMVATNANATINVRCHFDDGSQEVYTSDPFLMEVDKLYEFNCNPSLHGITLEQAEKKASHFYFWLDFSGTPSQVRSFYFDWRYCERPVFIVFANSLGGIDDVYFSGYIADKFQTEGELAEYPFSTSNTVFQPTIIPSGKTGQNKWTINSGWKSLTTLQFYRDLMLARQVWYLYSNISQTSVNIIPVIIDNADKTIVDRQKNLYSIAFDITEAHRSSYVFDNRTF